MTDKLFLFVDESGQDTKGLLFIVGIVAVKDNYEPYKITCEAAEQASGKDIAKWSESALRIKLDYIGRILHDPLFKGCLSFCLFHDTKNYPKATIETISKTLIKMGLQGNNAIVYIDALPKSLQSEISLGLRRLGTPAEKVRGIRRDENDSLIRLADSVCGLVRMAHLGNQDMQEMLDWAIRVGIIQDLS